MTDMPYTDADVEQLAATVRARIGWPLSAGEAGTIVTVVLQELAAAGRLGKPAPIAEVARWRAVLPHGTVKGISEADARRLAVEHDGTIDRSTVRLYADGTEELGPRTATPTLPGLFRGGRGDRPSPECLASMTVVHADCDGGRCTCSCHREEKP